MKPCISEATTMPCTFAEDVAAYAGAGWSAMEVWLTKLETHLEKHSASDTRTFPASNSGGSGLTLGGSSDTSAPVALYVDYLDESGNLCGTTGAACLAPVGTTPPTNWFYQRVWQITLPAANLKQITVTATIARGFGGAMKASSTLSVLKSNPF